MALTVLGHWKGGFLFFFKPSNKCPWLHTCQTYEYFISCLSQSCGKASWAEADHSLLKMWMEGWRQPAKANNHPACLRHVLALIVLCPRKPLTDGWIKMVGHYVTNNINVKISCPPKSMLKSSYQTVDLNKWICLFLLSENRPLSPTGTMKSFLII